MNCPKCGSYNPEGSKFCGDCGTALETNLTVENNPTVPFPVQPQTQQIPNANQPYPNQPNGQMGQPAFIPKKKTHGCLTAVLIILGFLSFCVIMSLMFGGSKGNKSDSSISSSSKVSPTSSSSASSASTAKEKPTSTPKPTPTPEPTPEPELVSLAGDPKNMKIGDTAKDKPFYVGLAYAKRGDTTKDAFSGGGEKIDPDHEVIFGFFDIFNFGKETKTFYRDNISGYCDGMQVQDVESYLLFEEDGVEELHSYELDEGTAARLIVNFEVQRGWKEFRFFFGSNAWVLTSEEVTDEPYEGQSAFSIDIQRETTDEGTIIYDDDYELMFDGFELYKHEGVFGTEPYAVFKFTLNNTSEAEIDYSLVGYNMRAYQDNYLLDDASFVMTDRIGDYINIYDIDSIKPGMSAKIYVPFEVNSENGAFYMVYDPGYITNNYLGAVNVIN